MGWKVWLEQCNLSVALWYIKHMSPLKTNFSLLSTTNDQRGVLVNGQTEALQANELNLIFAKQFFKNVLDTINLTTTSHFKVRTGT